MTGPLGLFGVAVVLFAGVTDALPPKKIVGGTKAAPGEFPYMVSIRFVDEHYCGGAIVSPRHIVTAAHCLEDIEPQLYSMFSVATGSVLSTGGTSHAFTNLISHPDYDPTSTDVAHDIGIVVLAEDIVFDENQASLNLTTELVPEGALSTITGWGYLDEQTKVISSELMKLSVKTLRSDSCFKTTLAPDDNRNSQICTFGGTGVGTCVYDSGGPLVYNNKLIGVVSHGVPCARGYPDVYTSVYHHLDWIKKTIEG